MNAMKHGLRAKTPVLPDEDEGEFLELREALVRELDPEGELMRHWVEEIALLLWRLKRCGRIEVGIFEYHRLRIAMEAAASDLAALQGTMAQVDELLQTTSPASRAVETLVRSEAASAEGLALLGRIAATDAVEGDALGKLSRYEYRLRRHLQRALEAYWELRWRLPPERWPTRYRLSARRYRPNREDGWEDPAD